MGYRPYNGAVDAMFGPNYYGYVDADCFRYGDRGGRFLLEGASVSQAPHTKGGLIQRLPVWSDEDDKLIVACPSWWSIPVVAEDGVNEGFVWVHRVSQDIDHWRHDRHPMEPENLLDAVFASWKKTGVLVFDSLSEEPVAKPKTKKKRDLPRWRR